MVKRTYVSAGARSVERKRETVYDRILRNDFELTLQEAIEQSFADEIVGNVEGVEREDIHKLAKKVRYKLGSVFSIAIDSPDEFNEQIRPFFHTKDGTPTENGLPILSDMGKRLPEEAREEVLKRLLCFCREQFMLEFYKEKIKQVKSFLLTYTKLTKPTKSYNTKSLKYSVGDENRTVYSFLKNEVGVRDPEKWFVENILSELPEQWRQHYRLEKEMNKAKRSKKTKARTPRKSRKKTQKTAQKTNRKKYDGGTQTAIDSYVSKISDHEILTVDEEKKLFKKYHDAKEGEKERVRNEIASYYLKFVIREANRYKTSGVPLEDLVQAGNIGLLEGIAHVDSSFDNRALSYIVYYIKIELVNCLITHGRTVPINRYVLKLHRNWKRARKKLIQDLEREPTKAELAEEMGIKTETLNKMFAALQPAKSLSAPVSDDDQSITAQDLLADPNDSFKRADRERGERSLEIIPGLIENAFASDVLTEREVDIISTYYDLQGTGEKATLASVGKKHGIGRERVRQIIKSCMAKLKSQPDFQLIASHVGLNVAPVKAVSIRKPNRENKTEWNEAKTLQLLDGVLNEYMSCARAEEWDFDMPFELQQGKQESVRQYLSQYSDLQSPERWFAKNVLPLLPITWQKKYVSEDGFIRGLVIDIRAANRVGRRPLFEPVRRLSILRRLQRDMPGIAEHIDDCPVAVIELIDVSREMIKEIVGVEGFETPKDYYKATKEMFRLYDGRYNVTARLSEIIQANVRTAPADVAEETVRAALPHMNDSNMLLMHATYLGQVMEYMKKDMKENEPPKEGFTLDSYRERVNGHRSLRSLLEKKVGLSDPASYFVQHMLPHLPANWRAAYIHDVIDIEDKTEVEARPPKNNFLSKFNGNTAFALGGIPLPDTEPETKMNFEEKSTVREKGGTNEKGDVILFQLWLLEMEATFLEEKITNLKTQRERLESGTQGRANERFSAAMAPAANKERNITSPHYDRHVRDLMELLEGDIYARFSSGFRRKYPISQEAFEDCVALAVESAIKYFEDRQEYITPMWSWFYTVLKNKIMDSFRREQREMVREINYKHDLETHPTTYNVNYDVLDRGRLLRFIEGTLPEEHASILKLRFIDGIDTNEIASRMNLSVQQVRDRTAYAFRALRKRFTKKQLEAFV